jgi:hypothetical protein
MTRCAMAAGTSPWTAYTCPGTRCVCDSAKWANFVDPLSSAVVFGLLFRHPPRHVLSIASAGAERARRPVPLSACASAKEFGRDTSYAL